MKRQIFALLSLGASAVAMNANSADAKESGHHGQHAHAVHEHRAHAVPANSWQLEVKAAGPLVKGAPTKLQVYLRDASGNAVSSAELARVHEEKIHLLVVDETLTDYHHVHPVEHSPGNFAVAFTPRVGGRYLVFADITDGPTQTQRYLRTEVRASGTSPTANHAVKHVALVEGYRFELSALHGINVAQGGRLVVQISDGDGIPVRSLEPVMGAFAHGVGFSSDLETVLHVHPHSAEPRSNAERAGPEIGFHVSPDRAGFYRLYVQVRINGRDLFASFGLHVEDSVVAGLSVGGFHFSYRSWGIARIAKGQPGSTL